MTKQLKLTAAIALLTGAAVFNSQAVSETNKITFTLTAYAQTNSSTANNGTVTTRVHQFALSSKTIVEALGGGASDSLYRVVNWSGTTTSTLVSNLTYAVSSVVYTNLSDVGTTNYVGSNFITTNLLLNSDSFTFSASFTNDSTATNAPIALTWTNSNAGSVTTNTNGSLIITNGFGAVTNGSDTTTNALTGFPGLTNVTMISLVTNQLVTNTVTSSSTNVSSSFFISSVGTPLTNMTPFSVVLGTVTNTNSLYPVFSFAPETNAASEFKGTDTKGLVDEDSGTVYSLVSIDVNAAASAGMAFRLTGFDTGSVSDHKVGTGTSATYYENTNETISVIGYGFISGFATTVSNSISTNATAIYATNAIPVLIKGTVSTSLYRSIK